MTTPFSPTTVQLAGEDPGLPQYWRTDDKRFWLGDPLSMMVELPSPSTENYTANATRGQTLHGLMGGGSAVTSFASSMRSWSMAWPRLAGRDWQIVDAVDRHLFGGDPLTYLPPEDVNRLTLAESMCGKVDGVVTGWLSSNGVAPTVSTAAPYSFPGGVMQWAPTASGQYLAQGGASTVPGVPDPLRSAPYVPPLPVCFSVRVKAVTGVTSAQVRLTGCLVNGSVITQATLPVTSVNSTSWTLLYLGVDANALAGAAFVLPSVVSAATAPLLICNPQLEYNRLPSDWAAGTGAPRVLTSTAGLGRSLDAHVNSSATLTLLEAVTGAA